MSQTRLTNVNKDNYEELARGQKIANTFIAEAFDPQHDDEPGHGLFFVGDAEQGMMGLPSIMNGLARAAHDSPERGFELLNTTALRIFLKDGTSTSALELPNLMSPQELSRFNAQKDPNIRKEMVITAYLKNNLGSAYQPFIAGYVFSPTNIFSMLIQAGLTEEAKSKWMLSLNTDADKNDKNDLTSTIMFKTLDNGQTRVICYVSLKNVNFTNTETFDYVDNTSFPVNRDGGNTYAQFELAKNNEGKWGWQLLNCQTRDPLLAKIIEAKELVTLEELEKRLGIQPTMKQETRQNTSSPNTSGMEQRQAFSASNVTSSLTQSAKKNILPEEKAYIPSAKSAPNAFHTSTEVKERAAPEKQPDASSPNLSDSVKQHLSNTLKGQEASSTSVSSKASSATSSNFVSVPQIEGIASIASRDNKNESNETTLIIIKLSQILNTYKEHIKTKLGSTAFKEDRWETIAEQAFNHKNPPDMPRAKRLAFKKYHALILLEEILERQNSGTDRLAEFTKKLHEMRGILDQKRNWYDLSSSEGSKITQQITMLLNEQQLPRLTKSIRKK